MDTTRSRLRLSIFSGSIGRPGAMCAQLRLTIKCVASLRRSLAKTNAIFPLKSDFICLENALNIESGFIFDWIHTHKIQAIDSEMIELWFFQQMQTQCIYSAFIFDCKWLIWGHTNYKLTIKSSMWEFIDWNCIYFLKHWFLNKCKDIWRPNWCFRAERPAGCW